MKRLLPVLSLFCLNVLPAAGQLNDPEANLKSVQRYHATIKNQSHLYNGMDFKALPEDEQEHPFFQTNEFAAGQIDYQGQHYSPVELLYNLATDQVIIEDGATRYNIQLIQQGVTSFSVHGHTFTSVSGVKELTDGFYDVLTTGPTRVLVKREKSLQHKIKGDVLQPWYQVKDRIFIQKGGQYFPIASKKALFSCFADKKDALKQHLRQQHLRFNAQREDACREAANFYDSH